MKRSRNSGEGPGRAGLCLGWGAAWLLRVCRGWHSARLVWPSYQHLRGGHGCGWCWECREKLGTEASLCFCLYDAGRNWKPEGSPFSLFLPSTFSLMPCVGTAMLDAYWQGSKGKKNSVPASAAQSRKGNAGFGAKWQWVKNELYLFAWAAKTKIAWTRWLQTTEV